MIHMLYDIYVTLSSVFSVLSSPTPSKLKYFLWTIPLLSWTEGATMRPMLGMLFCLFF